MNPLLLAGEVAAVASLVAGQFYDCYETYIGVLVQKTEVEASGNPIIRLIAKSKAALFAYPFVIGAIASGLFVAANSVHTGQAIDSVVSLGFVFAPCAFGAVNGYLYGKSNKAANAASLAAKQAAAKAAVK